MGDVVKVLLGISLAAVVLSFGCGLLLLLCPAWTRRATASLDRWVSVAPLFGTLDKPRYVERRFYRHHKIAGVLLVIGAAYTLVRLIGFQAQNAALLLPQRWGTELRHMLVHLGITGLAIANMAVLTIGVIVYFRPSLLRRGEMVANRWWSTAPALESLDTPHGEVNSWFWSHPRRAGVAMLVAGGYILGIIALTYAHLW